MTEPALTLKDTLHRLVDLARWPSEAEAIEHHVSIENALGEPMPLPSIDEVNPDASVSTP